jgi:hypothetical protein
MSIKAKITVTSIKSLIPTDKRLNDKKTSGFNARITPYRFNHLLFFIAYMGNKSTIG